MVMMSPQTATTNPAPADNRTSRTGSVWPVGEVVHLFETSLVLMGSSATGTGDESMVGAVSIKSVFICDKNFFAATGTTDRLGYNGPNLLKIDDAAH